MNNNLIRSKRLMLSLPLLLTAALFIPSHVIPSAHGQFTGLVCIVFPATSSSCPTSPPTYGPFTVGQRFTVGVFIQASNAMAAFDIFVKSDPGFVSPVSAALGTLIANPSLTGTSICVNSTAIVSTCGPLGPGFVEVSTIESSGSNECSGISPCSGLAFTITYHVVASTPSTSISYPTAAGCSASSVSSPANTCVLITDVVGTILPENIRGAIVTEAASHTTSTSVTCGSSVVVGTATSCTATITDTSTTGATNPTGTVMFSTTGSGTFAANPCPSLTGSGTNAATCTVSYTPTAVGTGVHNINATYSGDTTHLASFASTLFALTVNKATPTLTTGATSPIIFGGSTSLSATLTGGFPSTGVTGSVAYSRFAGTTCTSTATLIATVTVGVGNSVPGASDTPPSAGSFSYQAVYGGDANNNAFIGTCATIIIIDHAVTVTTSVSLNSIIVGQSTTISATLTGGFPSTGVTGTVTYTRFASTMCSGTGTVVATVMIGASNSVPSASDTPTPGSYSYQALYSGDANNNPATGTCAPSTVNPASPTVSTAVTPNMITLGQSGTVSAKLTGGFPSTGVTGTMTYTQFAGLSCTGTGMVIATVAVGAGNSVPTTTVSPSSNSSYRADYSGDSSNKPATGTCANLTVVTISPFNLSAAASSLSIPAGGSGSDLITVAGIGTFTGTVILAASVSPSSGLMVFCTPNVIALPPGGSGLSTCVFTASAIGIFTVLVTGTSGSLVQSIAVTVVVGPAPLFTSGVLHWTHHLSLSKSSNTQTWTAIIANPLSTSVNVVVRILGQSTILPGTNVFDVTCGVVCVNTNGNVNMAALLAGPVSAPVTSSFSFSFSQTISGVFSDQKIAFTATVYWATSSTYFASSSKSGSFAVVP